MLIHVYIEDFDSIYMSYIMPWTSKDSKLFKGCISKNAIAIMLRSYHQVDRPLQFDSIVMLFNNYIPVPNMGIIK